MQEAADRIVVLGRIVAVFGIKGWVKIQSYTDPPENLLQYPVWQLKRAGGWTPARCAEGRRANRAVLARMEECVSRDQAQSLVGAEIGALRSELPPLAAGEYYWEDLVGLEAFNPAGQRLGKVDHFREAAGHPLVVIRGEREHWVPLVRERLLAVDLPAGRMTVDWDPDW